MDDSITMQQRQKQRQFVRVACGRPRGQRAVVDSASTRRCVHAASTGDGTRPGDDGVVNGCRRPSNGDADALDVVPSRRGATTVQRPLLSSTPLRRQFTVDGGPLGLTTPEVVTPTRLTDSTNSISRQTIRRDVRSYDRILQQLRSESRVSVDVRTHVGHSDPRTMREKQRRETAQAQRTLP